MSATKETLSIVARVNLLLETCHDGERGYRAAAEEVNNSDLREMCTSLAIQRREFVRELESIVRSLREAPSNHGTALGALHRAWIHVRATVTNGNEAVLLAECERGEEIAVNRYREVLDATDLAPELHDILRLQYMGIQGAYEHVREIGQHFRRQQDHACPSAAAR